MARLLVYRAESLDREVQLSQLPVTIGRGEANGLVLDDPIKSVSRHHADLRCDAGQYTLTDAGSQNGIWVAGKRVASVALKPGVVATIGRFRLTVEPDLVALGTANPSPSEDPDAATRVVAAPPADQPAKVAPSTPIPRRPGTARNSRTYILAGVCTLLIIGLAGSVWSRRSADPVVENAGVVPQLVTSITQQLDQGACDESVLQRIDDALARDTSSVQLIELSRRARECFAARSAAAPPAPPAAPTVDLEAAQQLLAQGNCTAALEAVNAFLAASPEHADALRVKAAAEACPTATPQSASGPPVVLAVAIPPEAGGLEPLPGENDRDYRARVRTMRARYDEVVQSVERTPGRSAIALLDALIRDAGPRYLDVSSRLNDLRRALRLNLQSVLAEARALVEQKRWVEALQRYSAAQALDSSPLIAAEIDEVEQLKLKDGVDACNVGKKTISYNAPDAIEHFRRAIALLPPDHPCVADARRYVGGR